MSLGRLWIDQATFLETDVFLKHNLSFRPVPKRLKNWYPWLKNRKRKILSFSSTLRDFGSALADLAKSHLFWRVPWPSFVSIGLQETWRQRVFDCKHNLAPVFQRIRFWFKICCDFKWYAREKGNRLNAAGNLVLCTSRRWKTITL